MQNRVDQKVKNWENLLVTNKEQDEEALLKPNQNEEGIMEELRLKSEKFVLNNKGPVLPLNDVINAYKESKGDKISAQKIIKKKQDHCLEETCKQIYNIPPINIHQFLPEMEKNFEENNIKEDEKKESEISEKSNSEDNNDEIITEKASKKEGFSQKVFYIFSELKNSFFLIYLSHNI